MTRIAALRIRSTVRLYPLLVGALSIALLSGQLGAGTMGAAQGSGAVIFGNSTDTTDIASRIVIGGNGPASDELGDSAISLASRMISKSKTKTASVPYASTQHHVPQVQVIVDKSPHGWLEDRAPQST